MIKTPKIAGCVLVFTLLLGACGKDSRCGKSTGEIQTFTRELPAFDSLYIEDKIDIELKPSTVNRATITCGKNLVDYIMTQSNGHELIIRNDNLCNFLRSYKKPIKIVLEYTSLWKINLRGGGKINSTDTIKQPYLEVDGKICSGDFDLLLNTDSVRFTMHTGNSNVTLKGHTNRAYFYSGGTTILDALQLHSDYCFATNSGSGDFDVVAANYLYAYIGDLGYIYYTGNPHVDQKIKGTGEIIQK
ncbi:MAG TPA: head GIN domain-containing protein [Flavobacteriales bacterium]|nr:head GIN domain-containing protein [Flavobacteriales bacterium]